MGGKIMAMKYVTRFQVMGQGNFPMDMLRHDQAFPRTTHDAVLIEHTRSTDVQYAREVRTISLVAYHEQKWPSVSEGRWVSFGWPVVKDSIETEKL